jgi:hypothetical protein
MKKVEITLWLFSIVALLCNLLLLSIGNMLTILSFGTLSLFYFYFSFAIFNGIELRRIFKRDSYKSTKTLRIIGAVGVGISLSTIAIGLLFIIQSWQGGVMELSVGLYSLLVISAVAAIKYVLTKSSYYSRILIRSIIFGGIGLVFILLPEHAWRDFKYRNHPAYLEAVRNSDASPEDEKLWDKVDEERRKIYESQ